MPIGTMASAVHVGVIPTDVANLFYWVDAADPSTVDLTGSLVEEWRDRSPNGYEFWAASPADRPTYVTAAINGLNAMTWNTNRLQSRTNLPGHVSRTYCWIMNPTDTTVVITIMSIGGVMVLKIMADGQFHIANGNVVIFPVDCFGLHVWTAVFDGATSKVFKDGLQVWTGDAGTAGAATFRNDIGTDSFGGLPFLGQLPEMAVYSGVLSTTNREALETYLYSKWAGGIPGAPRLDTATVSAATPTTVTLGWSQGVNSSLVTDYIIEKSPNGTSSWTTVTESVSTATSYTVTGLTTGVIQYFRVSAVNEVGTGNPSNVMSATPGVPVVLDSFDRADTTPVASGGAGIGANWLTGAQGGGADQYHISSNSAVTAANFAAGTRVWTAAMASTNHEVSGRVAHTANSGGNTWLIARMPTTRNTTGYAVVLMGGGWATVPGGDLGVYIYRLDNEAETLLTGPYLLGAATGEWDLRLTVIGSTLTAYVDGVQRLTTTDTNHSTGTNVAFRILQASALQARCPLVRRPSTVMGNFNDKDPEDAYDAGDPLDVRIAVLQRIVDSLRHHRDERTDARRDDALRVVLVLLNELPLPTSPRRPSPQRPRGTLMGSRYLLDLADVCRRTGYTVIEVDDWPYRARGSGGYNDGKPDHVMLHHTGSPPSSDGWPDANYCTFGDEDAPLCNLYLSRTADIYICAAGATNTNGTGDCPHLSPDTMNSSAIGIEANGGYGSSVARRCSRTPTSPSSPPCATPTTSRTTTSSRTPNGRRRGKVDPAGESRWAHGSATWDEHAFRADLDDTDSGGFLMALSDQQQQELYDRIMGTTPGPYADEQRGLGGSGDGHRRFALDDQDGNYIVTMLQTIAAKLGL